MHIRNIALILLVGLSGCTSIKVNTIDPSVKLSHVCIQNNPEVIVEDFLPVVQAGFVRHGITTELYEDDPPAHCAYQLSYIAFQTWDMAMYMHHAELNLYQNRKQIGYAKYQLIGRGGLALNKWASVESKMTPVIDELLAEYTPDIVDQYRKEAPAIATETSDEHRESLEILKEWYEDGLIGKEEYDREKSRILSNL